MRRLMRRFPISNLLAQLFANRIRQLRLTGSVTRVCCDLHHSAAATSPSVAEFDRTSDRLTHSCCSYYWREAYTHYIIGLFGLRQLQKQEGLAVASITRDDPSTLPGDDPSPRARMHRDHDAR